MNTAREMRRLKDYEEIGLIGYPCDGDYIAVVGNNERQDWLLGLAASSVGSMVQPSLSAALPRYYPQGCRVVLVTVRDDWLIAIRDYVPQASELPS